MQQSIGSESKIYKESNVQRDNIYPGDPQGLPDDTLVFFDSGFLSKLSKHFGNGRYISYDFTKLASHLAKKQKLICKRIYYFTAPPFQSDSSTHDENIRRMKYDLFISKIKKSPLIKVEEGRVQRIKNEAGKYVFKQKGVDALIIMRLSFIPLDFPEIKKVILVSSDTDFCPVIRELQQKNVEVILYSYHERKRGTSFSVSTELIKCCFKYIKLTKEDFEVSTLHNHSKENLSE